MSQGVDSFGARCGASPRFTPAIRRQMTTMPTDCGRLHLLLAQVRGYIDRRWQVSSGAALKSTQLSRQAIEYGGPRDDHQSGPERGISWWPTPPSKNCRVSANGNNLRRLEAMVRGLESRAQRTEEDMTALITTVNETRDDVRWLKRAIQALLVDRNITIEPDDEPDE